MIKIISVHAPKAAGSMLLVQFQKIFGSEVFFDYQDDPADPCSVRNIDPLSYVKKPILDLPECAVVHGHFHPAKYDGVSPAFRVTFLRSPVENALSIYRFWRLAPATKWGSPLFRYFKENELDLESFASLPLIRNLYSESYFGGYDMRRFDFVGDYSFLKRDIDRLGQAVGLDISCSDRVNNTADIAVDLGELTYMPTEEEVERVGFLLERDIEFYRTYVSRN